jgi:putative endonuclease
MAQHNETGKKGEDAAAEFLKAAGHEIVVRNYRFGRAEVDIVSKHKGIYVFSEVKTRASNHFGYPEEFVSKKKMKLMKEAAEEFLYSNQIQSEIRFDVISIIIQGNKTEITHIPDAFFDTNQDSLYN